jgi:hypothetical protein
MLINGRPTMLPCVVRAALDPVSSLLIALHHIADGMTSCGRLVLVARIYNFGGGRSGCQ